MDPFAGVVVNQISTTVYGVVTSPIKNTYQIYEGVQDNNVRQIALGSLGLALDLAPFVKVPGLAAAGKAEDMMTLTRTISGAEAESIIKTQSLSFGPNNQMKQFWVSESSYETYIKAADGRFANGYKLQIQVPKSSVGEGKLFNTSVQVDQGLFPINTINSTTVEGKAALDAANKNISSFTISKE